MGLECLHWRYLPIARQVRNCASLRVARQRRERTRVAMAIEAAVIVITERNRHLLRLRSAYTPQSSEEVQMKAAVVSLALLEPKSHQFPVTCPN